MPQLIYRNKEDNSIPELWSCCWAPSAIESESTFIYSGLDDKIFISKWKDGNLELIDTYENRHSQAISYLKINPKYDLFVSTSLNGSIDVWKIGEKIPKMTYKSLPGGIWPSIFSADGTNLAVSCSKETGGVLLIDVNTKQEIMHFPTKGHEVTCACFSPDKSYIACCNPQGVVEVFDYKSAKLAYVMEGHAMPIKAICYSCDSNYLITGSQDALIKIYDGRNTNYIGSMSGHTSWITNIAPHPTIARNLISSSLDGTLKIWDVIDKTCIESFSDCKKGIWDAQYDMNGNHIGTVGESGDIRIYAA